MGFVAKLRKYVVEHRVGATIQVGSRHDLVPALADIVDAVEYRRRTRRVGQRRGAPLHCCNPLLQGILGRIHKTRIDVPELAQGEEIRGMLGIPEHIGTGAVDGQATRARGGVRLRAGMQTLGFQFHVIALRCCFVCR